MANCCPIVLLDNCAQTTWCGGTRNEAISRTQFRGGGWAYCSVRALVSQPDLSDSAVGRMHSAAQRLPRCAETRAVVAAPARPVGGQGQCRSAFVTAANGDDPSAQQRQLSRPHKNWAFTWGTRVRARMGRQRLQNCAPMLPKKWSQDCQKSCPAVPIRGTKTAAIFRPRFWSRRQPRRAAQK